MRRLEVVNKTKILLIIVILALVAVFIKSASVGAEVVTLPPYMTMNSSDRAISDVSYYALKECLTYGLLHDGINSDQLEGANVRSGTWFTNDWVMGTGRMVGSIDNAIGYFMLNPADANMKCGDSGPWITAVYTAPSGWNYSDMITALCTTTGAQRYDKPRDRGCPSNPGLFTGAADHAHGLTTNALSDDVFSAAIKNKIYGGVEPSAIRSNGSEKSKATQYIEDRRVLFTGCIGDPAPAKVSSGESANYLYNVTFVNGVGQSEPDMFYAGGTYGKSKTTKVTYLSGATGGNVTKTCGELETLVNDNSTSYKNVSLELAALGQSNEPGIVPNGAGTGGGASGPSNTCGSTVTGIGWLVCPITTAVVGLNDAIWKLASDLLTVNPITQPGAIYNAWNAIRSIANVLFVIFFLIIIFSQLTGAGITNYGIKKLLPRLIICAILVNISFVVIQIAVDLSNIAGIGLKNLLDGIATPALPTWGNLFQVAFNTVAASAIGLAAFVIAPQAALLLLLPMVVMGLLGLMAALLTLIFRQAIIPILAILAPLALVAYLLPNTEKWFKKWLDLLLPMLMLYPLAALVFGGAGFAASLIVDGHKDNFILNLIGMIVLTAPLFSLPFLARQGGSILKTVQGGLSKLAENARAPLKNMAKERSDAAQANYLANGPQTRFGQRLNEIPGVGRAIGFNRNRARAVNERKINRANAMEGDKAKFEKQVKENTTGNMRDERPLPPTAQDRIDRRTGMGAYMYAHEQKTDNQAAGTEAENQSGRRASGMAATDRASFAKDDAKNVENVAILRQGNDPTHRALKRTIHGLEQDVSTQTLQISHEADVTDEGKQRVDELNKGNVQSTIDKQDSDIRVGHTTEGQALKAETISGGKLIGIQNNDAEVAVSDTDEGRRLDEEVAAGKGQLANQASATTERLGETARGVKIAADKDVLQKQIKSQDAAVAHMVDNSAQGRRLDKQAAADEDIAKADTNKANTRYLKDDAYVGIRSAADAAEASSRAAQDERSRIITQVSSGSVEGTLAGVGAGMGMRTIHQLQQAKRASDKEATLTAGANRVAKKEFAKELAPDLKEYHSGQSYRDGKLNPDGSAHEEVVPWDLDASGNPTIDKMIKIIPFTDTALEMRGIEGMSGTLNAQASAIAELNKQDDQDVDSRYELIGQSATTPEDMIAAATVEFNRSAGSGDKIGLRAAGRRLGKVTGSSGKETLHRLLRDIPKSALTDPATSGAIAQLEQELLNSGIKDSDVAMDSKSLDHKTPLVEIAKKPSIYHKLTQQQLATQTPLSLRNGIRVARYGPAGYDAAGNPLGGINIETARDVLAHKSVLQISDDSAAILQAYIDGKAIPGEALESTDPATGAKIYNNDLVIVDPVTHVATTVSRYDKDDSIW